MTHNITLMDDDFQKFESHKKFLITKDKTIYATGDTIMVSLLGHREQLSFNILHIDRGDKVFKGWCVLALGDSKDFITEL